MSTGDEGDRRTDPEPDYIEGEDTVADDQPPHRRRRRGVYLLPNLFTTGVLFSGFFAIVSAINGEYITAAIAIFVAMVLDTLDGRVARMTDTQSEFGAQYDSLSDLVSFGVAPALVVYLWQLHDLGNFGWVAAFFFATAAALRLARFNSRLAVSDKRFFQGLPSPASAAILVGMVWVLEDWGIPAELADPYLVGILVVTVLAGAAMVSNLTYFSFKDMDFKHRVPFLAIVGVVLALMLLALDPPKVLLAAFVIYALSGPLLTLERWRRHRRRAPSGE
ncbi:MULTISPECIES: CDP-diacylglycerol--serine O-phosphatidyltransferase [unclassified Thioalkalivibrio]|uniref:CDP-diacylglycerol--serine O-phosphatidyltransferase n=1 Tax=unclassified Thioalkalivibrio TaxID=2621013 RepID=UPI00036C0C27|nr:MULTISPECIES: CDP-diacylglycerol--serine O-phosphatidyltransferase [unclassified Thioalkalivibrio]